MPKPAGAVRVAWSGIMPGGEIWESSFWTVGNPPADAAAATTLADLLWDTFASNSPGPWFTTLQSLCSANTLLNRVRTYVYSGGSDRATFVGEHVSATGLSGASSQVTPNQIALVMTLRSSLAGRAHRGRMYLPATKLGLSTTGNVQDGITAPVANAWATGFGVWNAASEGKVSVVSSIGAGSSVLVTSVAVDTRPDVQRRRANRQVIDSKAVAILPVG